MAATIAVAGLAAPARQARAPAIETLLSEAEALSAKNAFPQVIALLTGPTADGVGTPEQRSRLLCHLALAQAHTAAYDAALRSVDEVERLLGSAGQPDLRARVAIVRGVVALTQTGPVQAARHFERAAALATEAGHARLAATAYSSLANAAQVLGDWGRVLYFAERAWETQPGSDYPSRYRDAIQRGIAYFEFGELESAAAWFTEGLVLAEAAADRYGTSLALGELGLVQALRNGAGDRALDYFDRAIGLAREAKSRDLEVTWLLNSGNVYRDRGDLARALDRYQRGLDLERAAGQRRNLPFLLKNIGQTLALGGRPGEAEPHLVDAMTLADEQNAFGIRWQSRMELGLLARESDPAGADRYFSESLDLLEQQHSNVLLEGFRAGALGRALDQYDPYDEYIRFLLDRGEAANAFFVAERARARAFLDTLTAARDALAAAAPPAFVEAERDLLRRISATQAALRVGTLDPAARETARSEIARDEQALTALRLRLAAEQPALADARYPRVRTLDDLQRTVSEDEVLFELFLGRRASAAWIVGRDRVDVVRLPARAAIEAGARAYLEWLRTPGAAGRAAAAALFETLALDRVAAAAGGRRLVVVPHGILSYVPFEALVARDGRYLIEHRAVSYAPSASSLAFLRETSARRLDRPGYVLAVGDPALASAAGAVDAAGNPTTERALSPDHIALLKPLAYAGEELRRVTGVFGGGARLLAGADATEDRLAGQDLAGAAIVHIATHGLIDELRPERSALALTARPPGSDGILQMREVYALKLRAALVTLSACQTALGRNVTGEGIVGLSRAFFYAGANAVKASLWSVDDAATAQYMVRFYERLHRGDAIDAAARDAKLAMIGHDDPRLRHPYYWAAFTISGHGTVPVPLAGASSIWLPAVIAGLALIVGGGLRILFGARQRA